MFICMQPACTLFKREVNGLKGMPQVSKKDLLDWHTLYRCAIYCKLEKIIRSNITKKRCLKTLTSYQLYQAKLPTFPEYVNMMRLKN